MTMDSIEGGAKKMQQIKLLNSRPIFILRSV